MYQALAESPACQLATANELGLNTVFDYGKNLVPAWTMWTNLSGSPGIRRDDQPSQMAQAYGTFANDGVMNVPI